MKTIFLKILFILLIALTQLIVFNKLLIFGCIFNIILLLNIALILKGQFDDSILVAGIGGLVLDLASPLYFGIYTFLFLVICLFINFVIIKNFPTPNFIIAFIIFVGGFLFVNLLIAIVIRAFPWWQIIIDAALNGILGIFIYLFINRFIKKEEIQII